MPPPNTSWQAFSLTALGLALTCIASTSVARLHPALGQSQQSEFAKLAEKLAGLRSAGADEDQAAQDRALAILDGIILPTLNAPDDPSLEALNKRLASLILGEPNAGQEFRVSKLKEIPRTYALVANFSLGGPSAVRLYAGTAGKLTLSARIDRYAVKDFFDENVELLTVPTPADASAAVFVTIGGRTDEFRSGTFAAWVFDGARLRSVWSSDLLQQSSYELAGDGFRLTYCADPDDAHPGVCRRMVRDRYTWDGTNWKRVEQVPAPPPKH